MTLIEDQLNAVAAAAMDASLRPQGNGEWPMTVDEVCRAGAEEILHLRRRLLEAEGLLVECARDGLVAQKEEEIRRLEKRLGEATGQRSRYEEALAQAAQRPRFRSQGGPV